MGTVIQRANGNLIYFDTAESVVKNFPSKVTTHPIEEGSPITDHVVSEPKKIAVTGVISDASFMFQEDDPFTQLQSFADGTTRRVPIAGRSLAALSELEQIRDNRELFQLETRDEVFTDMVFTSFEVPRDPSTGDAARVRFTAQQITTVQRRFATVPQAVAADDADKAAENAETGRQATNPADTTSLFLDGARFATGQLNDLDPNNARDLTEIDNIINTGIDGG
jgi:hypothetical protein